MNTIGLHDNEGKWSEKWLLAIRPKTLPAAVAPVAVGTAVAIVENGFHFLPALACFAGALLLQIGVNLANDYFDYKNEIDSGERLGPVRVTQSGLISPRMVLAGMIAVFLLAALVFAYLASVGGMPIVVIGVASILAALGYSGGPYPIASHGLGALFVFIFFGLIAVCGTSFVQTGNFSAFSVVAAIPPGLLISAIMVVNNYRDIDSDSKAGKNTLAVKLGGWGTRMLFYQLLTISYLLPLAMYVSGRLSLSVLFPLLTVPLAWKLGKRIGSSRGQQIGRAHV
jgi:1,4-dihydroxy-2-naphthoate octaprenyltransferase